MESDDASRPEITEAFGALQTLLLSTDGIESFLQEVAELASLVAAPDVSCGITTRHDGNPLTVASSDARASALDESQYVALEGPCLQAMRTGEVVDVTDISTESRWPGYRARAAQMGLRCSLSLPLLTKCGPIGAMNLYDFERPSAFEVATRRSVEAFASQASTALVLALRQSQDSEVRTQLEEALSSRSVIDQALGILMGQQRCTSDEAFALLRLNSQNNQRPLRDVAADLVARTSGAAPGAGRPFDYPEASS